MLFTLPINWSYLFSEKRSVGEYLELKGKQAKYADRIYCVCLLAQLIFVLYQISKQY